MGNTVDASGARKIRFYLKNAIRSVLAAVLRPNEIAVATDENKLVFTDEEQNLHTLVNDDDSRLVDKRPPEIHGISDTDYHTGSGTPNYYQKANADGVPTDALLSDNGVFLDANGAKLRNVGGTSSIFRSDAQIEIQNDGSGHAMVSGVLNQDPPNNTNEGTFSIAAKNSAGTKVQIGSMYVRWQDPDSANGYSCVGLHPNYNGGNDADVSFEVFGAHGILMFGGPAATPPSGNYLQIKRSGGKPSLVGSADLVIDANYGGAANTVFMQGYNAGNLVMLQGGGSLGVNIASPKGIVDIVKDIGSDGRLGFRFDIGMTDSEKDTTNSPILLGRTTRVPGATKQLIPFSHRSGKNWHGTLTISCRTEDDSESQVSIYLLSGISGSSPQQTYKRVADDCSLVGSDVFTIDYVYAGGDVDQNFPGVSIVNEYGSPIIADWNFIGNAH